MSCSYCKSPNHTINNCSSSNILRLWFTMYQTFLRLKTRPECRHNDNRLTEKMYHYLVSNYIIPQLKVVCHRKSLYFVARGGSKSHYAERIIQECFSEYNLYNSRRWAFDRTPDYNLLDTPAPPTTSQKNVITVLDLDSDTKKNATFECGICLETQPAKLSVSYNCHHLFCADCVQNVFTHMPSELSSPICAFCRRPVTKLIVKDILVEQEMCKLCV